MVSPGAADVEAALLLVYNGAAEPAWRPLSLDPAATRWALAAALSLMFVFWTTRSLLERGGGLRGLARGLAWIGLALAGVMLVQKALAPQHIYGIISPTSRTTSPAPHGPFVNRNDYAMWVAMVTPVVIGYILARLASRQTSNGSVRVAAALDERMIWLCASATLLSASLLASLSRGGLMGMMAALLVLVALSRRRLSGVHVRTLVAALGVLLAVGTLYANIPALAERFGATLPSGLGGRLTLWREAWPMVPDFPIAGVGAGAFQRGMLVYQRSTRLIFFNHAHNEYLQLLIEGGLLLVIPAAVVIAAGASGIVRELRQDGTAMFWVRAGAAAGLVAAAVQSVWDTGLRMPANGVVFAILAAVAIHRVTAAGDGGDRSA